MLKSEGFICFRLLNIRGKSRAFAQRLAYGLKSRVRTLLSPVGRAELSLARHAVLGLLQSAATTSVGATEVPQDDVLRFSAVPTGLPNCSKTHPALRAGLSSAVPTGLCPHTKQGSLARPEGRFLHGLRAGTPPSCGYALHGLRGCTLQPGRYKSMAYCAFAKAVERTFGSLASSRTSRSKTRRLSGGEERSSRSAWAIRRSIWVSSRRDL